MKGNHIIHIARSSRVVLRKSLADDSGFVVYDYLYAGAVIPT